MKNTAYKPVEQHLDNSSTDTSGRLALRSRYTARAIQVIIAIIDTLSTRQNAPSESGYRGRFTNLFEKALMQRGTQSPHKRKNAPPVPYSPMLITSRHGTPALLADRK